MGGRFGESIRTGYNSSMSTEHVPNLTAEDLTATAPVVVRPPVDLHSGDRMTREEFHRLYERTPEGFKAELIGGIVYVASPVSLSHGQPHLLLGSVLAAYESRTPGVEASDNTTVLLGDREQPQPDLILRIRPEWGGQSASTEEDYIQDAPELVIEIAYSSRAIDLHAKKDDYTRYGVKEYLVGSVRDEKIYWFDLAAGKELAPDANGIYRIGVFPGLWINGPAVLAHDHAQLMATLEEGLATPEHAAFVEHLKSQRMK